MTIRLRRTYRFNAEEEWRFPRGVLRRAGDWFEAETNNPKARRELVKLSAAPSVKVAGRYWLLFHHDDGAELLDRVKTILQGEEGGDA